jgi:Na+(H+)/acetate symporter ActP
VFTIDLMRLFPEMRSNGLLRASRILTVVIGIPAIVIAAQGFDVLYLFLLADLVCAGAFLPVVYGFYSRRLTGTVAFWSAIVGIAAGALFFPKTDFTPWLNLPFAGDLLVSFLAPVIISALLIWICTALQRPSLLFDFEQLKNRTRSYGDSELEEKVGDGV